MLNLLAIRALQVLRRRDLMRSCEEGIKIVTHGESILSETRELETEEFQQKQK